jgi:hypothetical protein
MVSKSRVTILVKASPQPSKAHNETVCCAGIDDTGNWRRLFPVRFRQLSDDQSFKRWSNVAFDWRRPKSDTRLESCRVHEESIKIVGSVTSKSEQSAIVDRVIVASEKKAIENGASLALIRPTDVKFKSVRRSKSEIVAAKTSFETKAAQASFLDKELAAYEPCPFKFTISYKDEGGPHNKICADWETAAAFFMLSKKYEENEVLRHLEKTYTEDYPKTGLVFALGNMASRPQTWQLLGLFPVHPTKQTQLF